jgi:hypothetical protein
MTNKSFKGPAAKCETLSEPFQQISSTFNSVQLAEQILSNPDQLPIRTFYKRFPWLCKRSMPDQ